MKYVLSDIQDVTLELFRDATCRTATIELSPELRNKIDSRRAEFLNYVRHNRQAHLYGITTRQHVGAKHVLNEEELKEFSSRLPAYGASFGESLPDRLMRGIIVARLADYINGTGCLRVSTVERILQMLEWDELPKVPARGNGEPGDIIPLGALFQDVFSGTLEIGEGMALINGSPVSSAALADAALQSETYIEPIETVFALAALAAEAPQQHFDERLETLWNDPYIAKSLSYIRGYLAGTQDIKHLNYQAPVSFRSAPRVLGWLRRTVHSTKEFALTALRTSSNNPAFFGPDKASPYGAICSNGGYHSPYAGPALDALTRSLADTVQILTSVNNRVIEMPGGLLSLEPEPEVSTLYHVAAGWAEEARAAATATLISLANGGQTDTGTPDLLAWRKSMEAGQAVKAVTSVLAVTSAHAAARKGLKTTGKLAEFQNKILELFPIGTEHTGFAKALAKVRQKLFPIDFTLYL